MSFSQRKPSNVVASRVTDHFSVPAITGKRQRKSNHSDAGDEPHRRRLKHVSQGTDEHSDDDMTGAQRDETEDEDNENEDSGEEFEFRSLHHEAPRRRPRTIIDWRHEICTFLDQPHNVLDKELLRALYKASDLLRENELLRKQAAAQIGPPRFQTIHRIKCHYNATEHGLFLERPSVINYGPYGAHARSSDEISNMEVYLERNKEITFLVYRLYECCGEVSPDGNLLYQDGTEDPNIEALLQQEYIDIISSDLRNTIIDLGAKLTKIPIPNLDDEQTMLYSPYLWWFHQREQIQTAISTMTPDFQEQIGVFERYLQESFGNEWDSVDKLLASKRITAEFIHYLFVPNEVIVSKSSGSDIASLEGFWLRNWALVTKRTRQHVLSIVLESSHWIFDGNFEQRQEKLSMFEFPSTSGDFAITELKIYPQRFAGSETVHALQKRGRMFWKCRLRHYVSVVNQSDSSLQGMAHSRFMVDTKTYNEMHRPEQQPTCQFDMRPTYLPAAIMAEDNPRRFNLGDAFFMCLPARIFGFNMQRHEWETLRVADIEDVQWNDQAFDLLVLEQGTKDLVQAVVTNRLQAGEQTDVIHGKGNGLFLLLHGGPGTGKTLTAESVAEVAKRPLYRVTCGDIGTKAEEVEKYLESVLMLGKVWECVVLLDEADVFLEQRKLHHLERNALVSVFLRVLEYYDGILILTSNRVGTFDAAFKSRIQLSLRYSNLDKEQRRKIWENFINRLEGLPTSTDGGRDMRTSVSGMHRNVDVGINTDDIRKHLDELANYDINGREIRNAISTARQLAMFRGVPMGYEHLLTVIGEANKFQQYIEDLNQGFTADQLSNDRGERYHKTGGEQ